MAIVYIGIGSNLGDKKLNIEKAIELIREHDQIKLLASSELIETLPQGGPPQENYLNGVLKIETDLLPLDLLSRLKMIERRLGRVKSEVDNSPRPMDLDILFYDDVVIVEGKRLTIPHAKLHERFFVLQPLVQLAPDFLHPRLKKTVQELLDGLDQAAKA